MNAELLIRMEGGAELLAKFEGQVPTFHDAEVRGLALFSPNRVSAVCVLTIESNEIMTLNPDGSCSPDIRVLVEFELRGVSDLRLSDFYPQNVINGLCITREVNGLLKLEMEPCVGLHGMLQAQEIRISLPRS